MAEEHSNVAKVKVEVSIDTTGAMEQIRKLKEELESANSLANELADSLSKLKINIEV